MPDFSFVLVKATMNLVPPTFETGVDDGWRDVVVILHDVDDSVAEANGQDG